LYGAQYSPTNLSLYDLSLPPGFGTVYVRVRPQVRGETGTFAIGYELTDSPYQRYVWLQDIDTAKLSGDVGVFVFEADNFEDDSTFKFIALSSIQWIPIHDGTWFTGIPLGVPLGNTMINSFFWRDDGDGGDYYVAIVPIVDNMYKGDQAWIYTDGGVEPVRVTFVNQSTSLDFSGFKREADLRQ